MDFLPRRKPAGVPRQRAFGTRPSAPRAARRPPAAPRPVPSPASPGGAHRARVGSSVPRTSRAAAPRLLTEKPRSCRLRALPDAPRTPAPHAPCCAPASPLGHRCVQTPRCRLLDGDGVGFIRRPPRRVLSGPRGGGRNVPSGCRAAGGDRVPGQKGCGRNTRALPEAVTPGWFCPRGRTRGAGAAPAWGAQRSGCCPKSHTGPPPGAQRLRLRAPDSSQRLSHSWKYHCVSL